MGQFDIDEWTRPVPWARIWAGFPLAREMDDVATEEKSVDVRAYGIVEGDRPLTPAEDEKNGAHAGEARDVQSLGSITAKDFRAEGIAGDDES